MGDLESARSLTMSRMEAPSLFVLDPATHYYYLPPFEAIGMAKSDMVEFLADIRENKLYVSC